MRRRIAALALALTLAGPATAMASNGYSSTPGLSGVSGSGSSSSPAAISYTANTTTQPEQKGTLPFTGLDTGLMAATGAILVGFGVALRLGAKRRSHDG